MSNDEKLAETANLIENLLKKNDKFISLDYSQICFEYISDKLLPVIERKYNVLDTHMIKHYPKEILTPKNKRNFL